MSLMFRTHIGDNLQVSFRRYFHVSVADMVKRQIWEHKRITETASYRQCPHCHQCLGKLCECNYLKFKPKKNEIKQFETQYQLSNSVTLKEMMDVHEWNPQIENRSWPAHLARVLYEYNLTKDFFTMPNQNFSNKYGAELDSHQLILGDMHSGGSFAWTCLQVKRGFYDWKEYRNNSLHHIIEKMKIPENWTRLENLDRQRLAQIAEAISDLDITEKFALQSRFGFIPSRYQYAFCQHPLISQINIDLDRHNYLQIVHQALNDWDTYKNTEVSLKC